MKGNLTNPDFRISAEEMDRIIERLEKRAETEPSAKAELESWKNARNRVRG